MPDPFPRGPLTIITSFTAHVSLGYDRVCQKQKLEPLELASPVSHKVGVEPHKGRCGLMLSSKARLDFWTNNGPPVVITLMLVMGTLLVR